MKLRDRDYSGFRNTKQTVRTLWTARFGRDYGPTYRNTDNGINGP